MFESSLKTALRVRKCRWVHTSGDYWGYFDYCDSCNTILSTYRVQCPQASSGIMACIWKHGGPYLNSRWRYLSFYLNKIKTLRLLVCFSFWHQGNVFPTVDNLSLDTFYTAQSKLSIVKQTIGDSYRVVDFTID